MRLLLASIPLSAGAAVVLVGAGVCVAALAVHADAHDRLHRADRRRRSA